MPRGLLSVWIARVSLSASVKLTLRWETQDDLMSRYNVLWKTSSAQAARAQGNEDKLQDLRNERQRLREANKNKDAELLASKKCVLESEEQVRKERESVRQERDQEAARFRRQLQEMDELRRTEVQALEQRLSAAQATAKSAVDAQVAHLEREAAALATQLQEAREHGAKASVQAVEQLQTQLKALQASLHSKDKEVNELKEAARTQTQQGATQRLQLQEELQAAQAKAAQASAHAEELKTALQGERARLGALEDSFRELQDEKADREADAMKMREEVACFRTAEGKNDKELANCMRLLQNAQQAESALRTEMLQMKEAHEKALASKAELLQADCDRARAEVADLRAQLATREQDASAQESRAADARLGDSVHAHTRDLCLILGYLTTRVEDALAAPASFASDTSGDQDDHVPELIRSIKSRAGPRNPALLREASSLSAFSSTSASDSQATTPVPAAEGVSPPGMPPVAARSMSELFRAPAVLPRSSDSVDAGADAAVAGLCDATAEASAALHTVLALISKLKEVSKEAWQKEDLYTTVKDELQLVEDKRGQLKVACAP